MMISFLRLACFTVFFGRAWQHLFWDSPLRAIFWDENLLGGLFQGFFSITWHEYVTNGSSDHGLQMATRILGIFFLVAALLSLRVTKERKWDQIALSIGAGFLTFLSALYYKEKFYHTGQFLEYACQFGAPILLLLALHQSRHLTTLFAGAIALTFACHGLYAIGYYPVPGDFQDMTVNVLGVSQSTALTLLKVAGVLDILVAITIFLRPTQQISLLYCIAWGFATASARVVANTTWGNLVLDLHQWLPETIYRLPHGLIPLAAWMLYQERKKLLEVEIKRSETVVTLPSEIVIVRSLQG